MAELIDYAKKNPGKLTVATSSGASINHFMGELLKLKTGITWTEVHYRGNAPADQRPGRGPCRCRPACSSPIRGSISKAGRLRALAVLGPKRAPAVPDVPTIVEAGLPGRAGHHLQRPVRAEGARRRRWSSKLSAAIRAALAKKEVIDKLGALGSEARGSTPAEFTEFLDGRNREMDRRHAEGQHQGDE